MKSTKRLIQVILVSTPILILSGCFSSFSKDDLNQPIQEYLKTNYGIQGGFSVVETDNYWFQGVDHQTYVEGVTISFRENCTFRHNLDTF